MKPIGKVVSARARGLTTEPVTGTCSTKGCPVLLPNDKVIVLSSAVVEDGLTVRSK